MHALLQPFARLHARALALASLACAVLLIAAPAQAQRTQLAIGTGAAGGAFAEYGPAKGATPVQAW